MVFFQGAKVGRRKRKAGAIARGLVKPAERKPVDYRQQLPGWEIV